MPGLAELLQWGGAIGSPPLATSAGVVALIATLWLCVRRRPDRPHRSTSDSARNRAVAQAAPWLCELEQSAGEICRRIDERIQRLQAAERAADERLTRLSGLLDQVEVWRTRRADSVVKPRHAAAPRSPAPASAETADGAARSIGIDTAHSDELSRRVAALTARGRSTIDIAEELGRPLGEIELLRNLQEFAGR